MFHWGQATMLAALACLFKECKGLESEPFATDNLLVDCEETQ